MALPRTTWVAVCALLMLNPALQAEALGPRRLLQGGMANMMGSSNDYSTDTGPQDGYGGGASGFGGGSGVGSGSTYGGNSGSGGSVYGSGTGSGGNGGSSGSTAGGSDCAAADDFMSDAQDSISRAIAKAFKLCTLAPCRPEAASLAPVISDAVSLPLTAAVADDYANTCPNEVTTTIRQLSGAYEGAIQNHCNDSTADDTAGNMHNVLNAAASVEYDNLDSYSSLSAAVNDLSTALADYYTENLADMLDACLVAAEAQAPAVEAVPAAPAPEAEALPTPAPAPEAEVAPVVVAPVPVIVAPALPAPALENLAPATEQDAASVFAPAAVPAGPPAPEVTPMAPAAEGALTPPTTPTAEGGAAPSGATAQSALIAQMLQQFRTSAAGGPSAGAGAPASG